MAMAAYEWVLSTNMLYHFMKWIQLVCAVVLKAKGLQTGRDLGTGKSLGF